MKSIALTQGKVALVDDVDYAWLMQWKWCARKDCKNGNWYAVAWVDKRITGMHRLILHAASGIKVDHEDGDGLNNTRGNLRLATHADNMRNRRVQVNNTSGFKGVHWNDQRKRWVAKIKVMGLTKYIGSFQSAAEAGHAYDQKAREMFGEFARTNERVRAESC